MAGLSVWVDDHHPIFRAGIAAALRGEGLTVLGVSESLAKAPIPDDCDVVVFDAASDLQISAASMLSLPAVAIVSGGAMQEATAAVSAGVRGLLVRQELTPRRLASAVRAAHEGSWTCPSDLAGRLFAGSGEGRPNDALLTDREQQVLELVASGLSTEEIAEQLSYSLRTIKNQVQSILIKMDCRNRAHAVGVAVRHGWI